MEKLVSVLTTVYNGESYIEATIESILSQCYQNIEFIIVNDGSIDRSGDIIKSFNDSRIRYIELDRNYGVGEAINIGIGYAQGEYIAKADGDDLYDRTRLRQQVEFLDAHPEFDIIDAQIQYFSNNEEIETSGRFQYLKHTFEPEVNAIIQPEDIAKKLYWFPCITHSTVMYRASVLQQFAYRPLRVGEDYDLFYRMNKAGIKIAKLPVVLGKIRVSGASTTVIEEKDMILGKFRIKHEEMLKNLIEDRRIFIWGTGQLGKVTLEYLKSYQYSVTGFIDNQENKIGTTVESLLVSHKRDLRAGDYIFVASTLGKYEISDYLEDQGFTHLNDYIVIL